MPPLFLGEKLTQSVVKIDEDMSSLLKVLVKEKLADEYLHVSKREEVRKALIIDIKDIILPECKGNMSDPTYSKFYQASKEALNILKKLNIWMIREKEFVKISEIAETLTIK